MTTYAKIMLCYLAQRRACEAYTLVRFFRFIDFNPKLAPKSYFWQRFH